MVTKSGFCIDEKNHQRNLPGTFVLRNAWGQNLKVMKKKNHTLKRKNKIYVKKFVASRDQLIQVSYLKRQIFNKGYQRYIF